MNVVDSSGWLEYFADGSNAEFFAPAIEATDELVVPVISIYEVFRRIVTQRGENQGLQAVAAMLRGSVADLDVQLALAAAKLAQEHRLPMADSIILATARDHEAILWTEDEHFAGLSGVRYVSKQRS